MEKLDCKHLMYNDWVQRECFGLPVRAGIKFQWENDMQEKHWHKICPITLTKSMLLDNGFAYKDEVLKDSFRFPEEYFLSDNSYIFFEEDGTYDMHIVHPVFFDIKLTGLKYVHELQHALRIIKLNDFADSFKINSL